MTQEEKDQLNQLQEDVKELWSEIQQLKRDAGKIDEKELKEAIKRQEYIDRNTQH